MLTPSVPELILILVVVLVVFGPSKLPGIGQSLGKAIKNFKSSIDEKPDAEPEPAAQPSKIEQQASANQTNQTTSQGNQTKVN